MFKQITRAAGLHNRLRSAESKAFSEFGQVNDPQLEGARLIVHHQNRHQSD